MRTKHKTQGRRAIAQHQSNARRQAEQNQQVRIWFDRGLVYVLVGVLE